MKSLAFASLYEYSVEEIDKSAIGAMDPVLDALIAFEDSDGAHGFHEYFTWSSVDWDRFSAVWHTHLAERRAQTRFERLFVPRKQTGGKRVLSDIACETCKAVFRPHSRRERFCSQKCSAARFIRIYYCQRCGCEITKPGKQDFCSNRCAGIGRSKHTLTHKGMTMTWAEWAEVSGVSWAQIKRRAERGWTTEQIIETPVKKYKARMKISIESNETTLGDFEHDEITPNR